jgi:rod shape-determining protein MreB
MPGLVDSVLGLLSLDMGIDLGTANTLICVPNDGIVVNEPSMVAMKRGTRDVMWDGKAIGASAKRMQGRRSEEVVPVRALKDGMVADLSATEAMLSHWIQRVHNRAWCVKPRVVISVPWETTELGKKAVASCAERAGARQVFVIPEPLAAAIGAGLPVERAQATMVVDIGGGTVDIAVIAAGSVIVAQSVRAAGDKMDEAIVLYLKNEQGLHVGVESAERIKIQIGSVAPLRKEMRIRVRGRDANTQLPSEKIVTSEQLRKPLQLIATEIVTAIRHVLERTAPELSGDLIDHGICLTGGGALLRGLGDLIKQETQLNVRIANDPLTCVARGTGIILENFDRYRRWLEEM